MIFKTVKLASITLTSLSIRYMLHIYNINTISIIININTSINNTSKILLSKNSQKLYQNWYQKG